jgi:Flp pilus assembly protein TadG
VEFALVAPLFFAMIFGIVEAGRMLHVQQIMTNATREGARRAMIAGATQQDVRTVVREALASSGIDTTIVTDEKIKMNPPSPSDAFNGQPITVSLELPFSQVTWLSSPMFSWGTNRTMRAFTVMRRDTPN